MNTRPKTKKDGPSPYETDDAKWQAVVEKDPSGDGEFYYFQLAGAEVMLTDGRRLGTIEDIMSTGAHDVWVVRDGEREVLVPVISDVVKAMDLAARRVTIEAVPGLLD